MTSGSWTDDDQRQLDEMMRRRDAGAWLVLADAILVLRTTDKDKALERARVASIGRITTFAALARVGDASALRWFRNGDEVTR